MMDLDQLYAQAIAAQKSGDFAQAELRYREILGAAAIPEVMGDAGLLIDPTNLTELAQAMEQVRSDAHLRGVLVAKGIERALEFTWRKSALSLANAFAQHLETSGR